jgi:VWFA-related protein
MNSISRISLALLLSLPLMVSAQQTTASPTSAPPPASASGEGRIQLDVMVTDKAGNPVSGLEPRDFTLLDNNQPAPVLSFHARDGVIHKAIPPVEVILLIDTVNFPAQQVGFTRIEVEKFLRLNGGHLAHPTSIFFLTNNGLDLQPKPSSDGNALAERVENSEVRLRTIGNAAGQIGEAERFQLSTRMLTDLARNEAKKPGRKLLIWAGSGWPMLNVHNLSLSSANQQQLFTSIVELSTLLREARIDLYSISPGMMGKGTYEYLDFLKGIKSAEKANPPSLALRVLTVQSGGRVVGPNNDLAGQIENCVADADAFYTLSFDPSPAHQANEYHALKVQVAKPGLTARTNTGYYNQP